jgi:hypothetical protein
MKTAGAHLAACAAAPPGERTGQPVGAVAYINALAISGISSARLGPEPSTAPVWCVEGGFSVGEVNPVYWRNIAFDGTSGDADRITGADSRVIEIRLDAAGGEVAAKSGAAMSIYDVILGDADNADLIGIFNGRPSPSDVAKIVFGGPMRPYARFDRANKRIELITAKPPQPSTAGP